MKDMDVKDATQAGIDYRVRKVHGRGGVIVIDKNGYCAKGFIIKNDSRLDRAQW